MACDRVKRELEEESPTHQVRIKADLVSARRLEPAHWTDERVLCVAQSSTSANLEYAKAGREGCTERKEDVEFEEAVRIRRVLGTGDQAPARNVPSQLGVLEYEGRAERT